MKKAGAIILSMMMVMVLTATNMSGAYQPTSTEGQNATGNTNTIALNTNASGVRSAGSTDVQHARMAQTGDDMYERLGLHTLVLLAALLLLIAQLRKLVKENQ